MIQIEKTPFHTVKYYGGVWQNKETEKSYNFTLVISEDEHGNFSHDIMWESEIPNNEENIKEKIMAIYEDNNIINSEYILETPKEKIKVLTEEDFYKKYTLIKNPFDEESAYNGFMFETYGIEILHILQENQKKVWTIIDSDGWFGICAGFHRVNRIGYFISIEEWSDIEEEYVIYDEYILNEWVNGAGFKILEKEFGVQLFGLNEEETENVLAVVEDMWNKLILSEKREIINKYKNEI